MKLNNLLVLYVYDKHSSKDKILPLLQKNLKKVFTANNLKQARSCYKKYSPCIIVLDDSFSDNTMVKFLQEVRQSDIKTAFIVLSANKTNAYLYDLMELFITKYILKPFCQDKFLEGLQKCLEVIESRIYSNVNLGNGILFNFQTQSITKDGRFLY